MSEAEDKFVMQGATDSFVVDYSDFSIGIGDEILVESRVFSFTVQDTEIDQEVEFAMMPDEVRKLRDWLDANLVDDES